MTIQQQIQFLTRKAGRMTDPALKAALLERAERLATPARDTRTDVQFPRIGWLVACTWQTGGTYGYQLNGNTVDGFTCRRERDAALRSEVRGD